MATAPTDYNKMFWGYSDRGRLRDLQELYQMNKSIMNPFWKHPEFDNSTPFMRASQFGHTDVVTWLLDTVPDMPSKINDKNLKGNTALILAAYYGYAETVSVLIRRGADVNIQNKDSETALKWAALSYYDDVAYVLMKNGADPTVKNYEGKVVMDRVADRAKYYPFATLLRVFMDPDDWQGKVDLWYEMKDEHRKEYKAFWENAMGGKEESDWQLTMDESKQWLKMSGLSDDIVEIVFGLTSKGRDYLDIYSFCTALRYLAMAQNNEELNEAEMLNPEKKHMPTITYPEPPKKIPRYEAFPMEEWTIWDIHSLFMSLGAEEKDLKGLLASKIDGEGLKETDEVILYDRMGIPYGVVKRYTKWLKQNKARLYSAAMNRLDSVPIEQWTIDDVCALFLHLGAELSDVDHLKKGRVSGAVLLELTDEELKEDLKVPIGTRKAYRKWLERRQ